MVLFPPLRCSLLAHVIPAVVLGTISAPLSQTQRSFAVSIQCVDRVIVFRRSLRNCIGLFSNSYKVRPLSPNSPFPPLQLFPTWPPLRSELPPSWHTDFFSLLSAFFALQLYHSCKKFYFPLEDPPSFLPFSSLVHGSPTSGFSGGGSPEQRGT